MFAVGRRRCKFGTGSSMGKLGLIKFLPMALGDLLAELGWG